MNNDRRSLVIERLEDRRVLTGPYAPAAGQPGSTAIPLDDPRIIDWAQGWEDYLVGEAVDPEWQTPERALGPATGDGGDIVALGRAGRLTVTFQQPIRNGGGPDFAIFENGFADQFLDLAFVEVSSDGSNFFRFPNDSRTESAVGPFGQIDPTGLQGLAGKYRIGFGTPFDLEQLTPQSLLDLERVTHVRIIDILGDGTVVDSDGDAIFDPYPTTGSAGFDLEAVGVLHVGSLTVGFEDLGELLPPEGHWNGPAVDGASRDGLDGDTVVVGEFESQGVRMSNVFSQTFGSWNGWAYSNMTDTTTAGFSNQFSAIAGSGAGGSSTYAIGFRDIREGTPWVDTYPLPSVELSPELEGYAFQSVAITNTTFAALSMLNGDPFSKKFGGVTGDDPDWFLLTIEGKAPDGGSVGTIDFYLADYRFADNSQDYIVDDWVVVDLSSLATASSLEFKVTSSDEGDFGINTPAYFALDNVELIRPMLQVTSLNPTPSGFVAELSGVFDATGLNLVDTQNGGFGPADVTLAGQITGPVRGSLVVAKSGRRVEFVKSGGPLLPDEYSVKLRGALDGFRTLAGISLDGDQDGSAGGDYQSVFTIVDDGNPVTLTLADLVRGPGQEANVPADLGTGIPLILENGTGVRGLELQLSYDPALVSMTAATLGASMPADSTLVFDNTTSGLLSLTVSTRVALSTESITIANLHAQVPSRDANAIYGQATVLDITEVSATGADSQPLSAVADKAVFVVSYFGDVSGNGRVNSADASFVARVAAGLDGGFAFLPKIDPGVVGDITANRRLNAVDASRIARFAASIDVPEIPPIPDGLTIEKERPGNWRATLSQEGPRAVTSASSPVIDTHRWNTAQWPAQSSTSVMPIDLLLERSVTEFELLGELESTISALVGKTYLFSA